MRFFIFWSLLFLLPCFSRAQDTIMYKVSFPNAVHHEAEIQISYKNLTPGPLTLRMSVSSPGRYALHQFGKNVYNVVARSGTGDTLDLRVVTPGVWTLNTNDGIVTVSYTLYANHPDGTYSGIENSFAHLNMPATFMWAKGLEDRPMVVDLVVPDSSGWKVATQLLPLENGFFAPDLQYFMDSPVTLGDFTQSSYIFEEKDGRKRAISLVVNPAVNEQEFNSYFEKIRKVVAEEQAVYGELPDYDYGKYTFLCNYAPFFVGDAMEHRNSTMISSEFPLKGNQEQLISSVAHEFFHCWNVERIRPFSLEPFNFEKENMSGELWFSEGFTQYYESLILCRAGIYSRDQYIHTLGGMLNYVLNSPGMRQGSPVYMSQLAPYVDAARYIDKNNFSNTFITYYYYGAIIGLALDLELRNRYKDLSLDDFMRTAWTEFGKPEIPFDNADLKKLLGDITGDAAFAEEFFSKYVFRNEIPDYARLFKGAGFNFMKKNPGKATIGWALLDFSKDTTEIISPVLRGTPLYEAGLEKGDKILTLDGQKADSYNSIEFIVGSRKPGDEISVTYLHNGIQMKSSMTLTEDDQTIIISKEKFSAKLTRDEAKFRDDWLSSKP